METTPSLAYPLSLRELVLYRGASAKSAHKELFRLDDPLYFHPQGTMIDEILAAAKAGPSRLHVAGDWETILGIALWSAGRPSSHDVLSFLMKCGITGEELVPFRGADISDLFPWLYYGKRFDVLRRICNAAKAKAEARANRKNLIIYCHLVYEENSAIIASSL